MTPRGSTAGPARGRASGDRVLRLQAQLTDRDRLLLDWLADHQVLTTAQIAHALFGSRRFAQRRLLTLHQLGLLDRFRPLRPGGGSHPWHYLLDHTGAELIAAARGQPPPRRSHTTDRNRRIATSPLLAHRLGINQFFTDLAGWARTHPPARLDRWWSERACATPGAFGLGLVSPVRPDGHGILTDAAAGSSVGTGRRVAFFLEHDHGTEPHPVLAGKLARYSTHAHHGGPAWPVLFWLPSTAREKRLHQLLDQLTVAVPVATAARDHLRPGTGPADAVWLVHGKSDPPRTLLDLAGLGDPAPPPDQPAHTT